jgi:LacI family transcriptional regulator
MSESPTMVDVARVAGVSLKTVSRVVNEEPGVSAENTARVRDAVATLGYRANDVARSLRRRQRAATIGLVVEDIQHRSRGRGDGTPQWAHRRHRQLRREPEGGAGGRGHAVVAAGGGPVGRPCWYDHSHVLDVIRRGTPCVFMGRPPGRVQGDTILLENAGGARKAAHHLTRLGHRRVGAVGDPGTNDTVGERVAGFRDAVASAEVQLDESLVRLGARDVLEAEAAMRELLSMREPPTAISATNDRASLGVCTR